VRLRAGLEGDQAAVLTLVQEEDGLADGERLC
jgi:hypothetical protein